MIKFNQSELHAQRMEADRKAMRRDFIWFGLYICPIAGVIIYCVLSGVPL